MKLTKKVENSQKKYFEELSGARSTRKLIEIHNRCLLLRSEKFHDSIFPSEGHKTGKIQISVSRKKNCCPLKRCISNIKKRQNILGYFNV